MMHLIEKPETEFTGQVNATRGVLYNSMIMFLTGVSCMGALCSTAVVFLPSWYMFSDSRKTEA